MTQYVLPGHTFVLKGTLAQGDTLVAEPGTAHKSGATVLVRGKATNSGAISLGGGNSASIGGASLVDSGVLTNAGTITVSGGDHSHYGALLDVTGTLVNDLSIVVQGASYSNADSSATLSISGTFQNNASIYLGYGRYSATGGVLADSGTMTNAGTLTAAGGENGGGGYYPRDEGGTIGVTGVLTNTGLIKLDAGYPVIYAFAGGYGGVMTDAGVVINNGTIVVGGYGFANGHNGNGGTLSVTGSLANTGVVTVQPGAILTVASAGTLTNAGALTVDGGDIVGGEYDSKQPEATFSIAGAVTNSGTLDLVGGIPGLNPLYFGYFYGAVGAQMAVSGTFTNTDSVIMGGGSGDYYRNVFHNWVGSGATLALSGVLVNQGSIELHGGLPYSGYDQIGSGSGAAVVDSGALIDSGLLTIDGGPGIATAAVSVTASGTLTDTGTITGSGTLDSAGTIGSGGNHVASGVISVAAFMNDGTVTVAPSGAFLVDSAVTAHAGKSGVLDISGNATLTLGDAIAASQTVGFLGAAASLSLGNALGFAGTLDGLAPRDSIDFLGLAVKSASTSGTTLDIGLAGGTTLDLALGAPLTGVSFTLTHDGSGGTDLTLHQTPAAFSGVSYDLTGRTTFGAQTALGGAISFHLPP
jgi:hypothetical protein